jgi:uncharacterized cofD-like protein
MAKNKSSKIVCLGGGNAMPKAVLAGLKKYPVDLAVISATLDTGGSTGALRKINGGIAFGDIRRAVLALSRADEEVKNYFAHRDWDGHVVANIYCAATAAATGSPEIAIERFRKALRVPQKYQILPVTIDDADICAVLENGQTVQGETNIDVPKHNAKLKIKEVFLKPEAKAYPGAIEAIKKADLIVIGPGDLYSSLAQVLLVKGIAQALRNSKAKKVYVCNLMQKNGETNDFTVADFAAAIEKFIGENLDYVIYNNSRPNSQRLISCRKEHPELLDIVENRKTDSRFLGADLITDSGLVAHDANKLAKTILSLCKQ